MKSISRLAIFYLSGVMVPGVFASTPFKYKNEFLNVKINPFNQNVDKTKFITPDLKKGSSQLTGKNETYYVANINVDGTDESNCADKSNPNRCKTIKSSTITIKDENNNNKGELIVPSSIGINNDGFVTNTPSFIDTSTANPGFYRYWDFATRNWSAAVPIICTPDSNIAIRSNFESSPIVAGYLSKINKGQRPNGLFGDRKIGDYNEYSSNKSFDVGIKLRALGNSSSINDIKGLSPIKWSKKSTCLLPIFDNRTKITSNVDTEQTNIIDPFTGVIKQQNIPMKICNNASGLSNSDLSKQPSEICGKHSSYKQQPYISFYNNSDEQYYNKDYEILLPTYNTTDAKTQGSTYCSGDYCNTYPIQYLATGTCAMCDSLNDNDGGSCEEIIRGTLLDNGCTKANSKISCSNSQLDKAVGALVQNSNFTGRDTTGKKVGSLKNTNLTCSDCIGSLESKLKQILTDGGGGG